MTFPEKENIEKMKNKEQLSRLMQLRWHGNDLDECMKTVHETRGQIKLEIQDE